MKLSPVQHAYYHPGKERRSGLGPACTEFLVNVTSYLTKSSVYVNLSFPGNPILDTLS